MKAGASRSAFDPAAVPVKSGDALTTVGVCGEKEGAAMKAKPADGKLPPDLLEWARQSFNEEEFLAGVREIRATGGLEFDDFVKELERAAGEHE
jgi:hypothetical protein